MPIYDYQCQKCGHEFEKEQRIVEDPIKKCPACKSNKAKRLISKTSFVLKGGGWYNDLYSSTGADSGSKEKSSDETSPSAKSSEDSSAKKEPSKKESSKGDAKKGKKKSAA